MGQLQWTYGLAFIVLFIIAITTFAYNFGNENSAPINLEDDDSTYDQLSGINATIEEFYEDSNNSYVAFKESDLSSGVDFTAAPSTLRKDFGYLSSAKQGISSAYTSIFGGNQGFGIFLTALLGLIGITTVAYWWKSIKGGLVD